MRLLYNLLIHVVAPVAFLLELVRGIRDPSYRERRGQRLGFGPRAGAGAIWVHAVSVGEVQAAAPVDDFAFGIGLFNSQGISCYGTNTNLEEYEPVRLSGEGRVVFRIERLNLINGTYYLDVAVHKRDGYPYDYHQNLYSFLVSSTCRDVGISRPAHVWDFSRGIEFKAPGGEKGG